MAAHVSLPFSFSFSSHGFPFIVARWVRTSGSCFTKGSKGDSSLQASAVDICSIGFDLSIATTI